MAPHLLPNNAGCGIVRALHFVSQGVNHTNYPVETVTDKCRDFREQIPIVVLGVNDVGAGAVSVVVETQGGRLRRSGQLTSIVAT